MMLINKIKTKLKLVIGNIEDGRNKRLNKEQF